MANLYTKTGDRGTTGLVGGSRVSKADGRVHCYGTVDEANAMLGLAYALSGDEEVRRSIDAIQRKLFLLAAELASDEAGVRVLGEKVLGEEDVTVLEELIDRCTVHNGTQQNFVIPGVNPASAALHVSRTILRRAERAIIGTYRPEQPEQPSQPGQPEQLNQLNRPNQPEQLEQPEQLPVIRQVTLRYINRLSDAVYALARLEETRAIQRQEGRPRDYIF